MSSHSAPAPARVLVVEDDRALSAALVSTIGHAGYQVTAVSDGLAAVRALESSVFELVLLDIGLPFVNGWKVLEGMKSRQRPSTLVISARGDTADKIRALDLGADDYLAKPFDADELLARVRAILRRAIPLPGPPRVVRFAGVAVDLGVGTVFRDGVEVRLSPTEYALLAELASHAGEVLPQRTLLQRVWGPAYGDELNYLRTFAQRLRLKLEPDPHSPQVIVTVGTRGYRFGAATPSAA
jgi:two-component system, OmpR family, KDP operon response regulator KdpE